MCCMLTCDNLTCTSWGLPLFKGLGFSLLRGSLLAITGGSARAKTTLLDVMAARVLPKRGEVTYDGKPAWHNVDYFACTHYIEKTEAPDKAASVEDYVNRFAALYETENLVPAALRFFGLSGHAQTRCGAMPAHLIKRVVLARLLSAPCSVWMLDRPVDGLDEEGAGMLYSLISARCTRGGIVALTADDANFIEPIQELKLDDFN